MENHKTLNFAWTKFEQCNPLDFHLYLAQMIFLQHNTTTRHCCCLSIFTCQEMYKYDTELLLDNHYDGTSRLASSIWQKTHLASVKNLVTWPLQHVFPFVMHLHKLITKATSLVFVAEQQLSSSKQGTLCPAKLVLTWAASALLWSNIQIIRF